MNTKIFKSIGATISKHSPAILTGVGIAGTITTAVLAVRATPKALRLIDEKKEEAGGKLTPLEVVKTAWMPYIPAAITCTLSVTCLIFAQHVNVRRNAALMAAYELSENALTEYRGKTVELLGKEKENEIREAINQDKVNSIVVPQEMQVILPDDDTVMCYEPYSGRSFKSNETEIRRAINELNYNLITDGCQTLNEFYDCMNNEKLERNGMGDLLGWSTDDRHKIVEPSFSSHLTSNGVPCLVVSLNPPPTYLKRY